jgi:hypothetical protein
MSDVSSARLKAAIQTNIGLRSALNALAFFHQRHRWKEPGSRKGALVRHIRIKDWSHYHNYVRMARQFIREARAHHWRGSMTQVVKSITND